MALLMVNPKFIINLNDQILNEETAKISVLDRGLLYGDSVYEATYSKNYNAFRLSTHLDRLYLSAKNIYFEPQTTKEHIIKEVERTLLSAPYKDALIRIVLSRGTNSDLGLNPELALSENLIIYVKEFKGNPESWYKNGVALTFYQSENAVKGPLSKTGNYLENMLAHRLALKNGFFDSIMVNSNGFVTECTTSNIWCVKNGLIKTPTLSSGVLPGTTRSVVLDLAGPFQFAEVELTPADFINADECFLTSTSREIVPVTKIDKLPIGNGLPGPMTVKLLESYRQFVQKELI
jgi:branched-chain amino acid aminotransferase